MNNIIHECNKLVNTQHYICLYNNIINNIKHKKQNINNKFEKND